MLDFDEIDAAAAERVAAGDYLDDAARAALARPKEAGQHAAPIGVHDRGFLGGRDRIAGRPRAAKAAQSQVRIDYSGLFEGIGSDPSTPSEAVNVPLRPEPVGRGNAEVKNPAATEGLALGSYSGLFDNLDQPGVRSILPDEAPLPLEEYSEDTGSEALKGGCSEDQDKEAAPTPRKRAGAADGQEDDSNFQKLVQWEPHPDEVHFRILEETLPMRVPRHGMRPCEVAEMWEQPEWGVSHARQLRFSAPPDSGKRWLNPREDTIPCSPEIVRLEGRGSILYALSLALTRRDPRLQARAEEEARKRYEEDKRAPALRGRAGAKGGAEMEPRRPPAVLEVPLKKAVFWIG